MPTLFRVFYISRSLAAPTDITAILEASRGHNLANGITGSLVFTGGHFAQLLEGTPQSIGEVMANIDADPRHEQVKRLLEGAADRRRFENWAMAFVEAVGADDLLSQLLQTPEVSPQRAERMLELLFKPATQN